MATITYNQGSLYLDRDVYETYLGTYGAAVLLQRDDRTYLVPVQQAAGGLLIKIRNANGDRVINAQEFFQHHNLNPPPNTPIEHTWNSELHALELRFGAP